MHDRVIYEAFAQYLALPSPTIRSHEQLKVLYDDILKKAGFFTTKEARNIFHGTVEWKYLKLYRDSQLSKDAIIPDILIHNYPSDTNGHGNAAIAADGR
jgi:hypothetical protein